MATLPSIIGTKSVAALIQAGCSVLWISDSLWAREPSGNTAACHTAFTHFMYRQRPTNGWSGLVLEGGDEVGNGTIQDAGVPTIATGDTVPTGFTSYNRSDCHNNATTLTLGVAPYAVKKVTEIQSNGTAPTGGYTIRRYFNPGLGSTMAQTFGSNFLSGASVTCRVIIYAHPNGVAGQTLNVWAQNAGNVVGTTTFSNVAATAGLVALTVTCTFPTLSDSNIFGIDILTPSGTLASGKTICHVCTEFFLTNSPSNLILDFAGYSGSGPTDFTRVSSTLLQQYISLMGHQVVVIALGRNSYTTNYLTTLLANLGTIPVILIGPYDNFADDPTQAGGNLSAIRDQYNTIATTRANTLFLNLFDDLGGSIALNYGFLDSDSLHPGQTGASTMAMRVKSLIDQAAAPLSIASADINSIIAGVTNSAAISTIKLNAASAASLTNGVNVTQWGGTNVGGMPSGGTMTVGAYATGEDPGSLVAAALNSQFLSLGISLSTVLGQTSGIAGLPTNTASAILGATNGSGLGASIAGQILASPVPGTAGAGTLGYIVGTRTLNIGPVPVAWNYNGNDFRILRGLGASQVGISGAQVYAYINSEYIANPNTAPVRGYAVTNDAGQWSGMGLSSGVTYLLRAVVNDGSPVTTAVFTV